MLRLRSTDFFFGNLGEFAADSFNPASFWNEERHMVRFRLLLTYAILFVALLSLCGREDLAPHDTSALIDPNLKRSEVVGFVAGLGTTFAAVPDLLRMLKRRSSTGMSPRMAAIMGIFQVIWIYYGLLIASRPVIAWNMIAVLINFLNVYAYRYFVRKERAEAGGRLRA
jgi:MtN3 and saliva related transmembrane protein